jgi:hypothetical protein
LHLQLGNYRILQEYQNCIDEVALLLAMIFGQFSEPLLLYDVYHEILQKVKNVNTDEEKVEITIQVLKDEFTKDD